MVGEDVLKGEVDKKKGRADGAKGEIVMMVREAKKIGQTGTPDNVCVWWCGRGGS